MPVSPRCQGQRSRSGGAVPGSEADTLDSTSGVQAYDRKTKAEAGSTRVKAAKGVSFACFRAVRNVVALSYLKVRPFLIVSGSYTCIRPMETLREKTLGATTFRMVDSRRMFCDWR